MDRTKNMIEALRCAGAEDGVIRMSTEVRDVLIELLEGSATASDARRAVEMSRLEHEMEMRAAATPEGKAAAYYTHCGELMLALKLGLIDVETHGQLYWEWKKNMPAIRRLNQQEEAENHE